MNQSQYTEMHAENEVAVRLQYLLYYLNYKAKQKLKEGMDFRMDILQACRWLVLAAIWSNCLDKS